MNVGDKAHKIQFVVNVIVRKSGREKTGRLFVPKMEISRVVLSDFLTSLFSDFFVCAAKKRHSKAATKDKRQ
jgi:hypothetical protein